MKIQKLRDMQAALMLSRSLLSELRDNCNFDSPKWHEYEKKVQNADEKCDEIRIFLEEMRCCV